MICTNHHRLCRLVAASTLVAAAVATIVLAPTTIRRTIIAPAPVIPAARCADAAPFGPERADTVVESRFAKVGHTGCQMCANAPRSLHRRYTVTSASPKIRTDEIWSFVPGGTCAVDRPVEEQKTALRSSRPHRSRRQIVECRVGPRSVRIHRRFRQASTPQRQIPSWYGVSSIPPLVFGSLRHRGQFKFCSHGRRSYAVVARAQPFAFCRANICAVAQGHLTAARAHFDKCATEDETCKLCSRERRTGDKRHRRSGATLKAPTCAMRNICLSGHACRLQRRRKVQTNRSASAVAHSAWDKPSCVRISLRTEEDRCHRSRRCHRFAAD